ncbi:DsrE family protein [Marinimicrobium sp. C2-29]|uniref:DsrE family protein n=1 Tax=Marinimicrobium sp. C2-29 TaxID=3139825 RepID=UPI003138B3FD
MHYAISTTWGPTDTTRASLPFIFAATALEAGDTVTIMLFHDAVTVAVKGAHEQMVPCGPGPKFAEVFAHKNAEIIVCKPCAQVRGLDESSLIDNCRMGGMGDFYKQVARDDCKPVTF